MDMYKKVIDGELVIKRKEDITVTANGMTTYHPLEEQLLADGWVRYEYTDEQKAQIALLEAKRIKAKAINDYDTSAAVNLFYYQSMPMWLDKATRAGLLLRFQAEKAQELVSTCLWYNRVQYTLPVDQAIQMLYAIELYASACYDNTQRHLAAVNAMTTVEEIENYDHTVGYPEKLNF